MTVTHSAPSKLIQNGGYNQILRLRLSHLFRRIRYLNPKTIILLCVCAIIFFRYGFRHDSTYNSDDDRFASDSDLDALMDDGDGVLNGATVSGPIKQHAKLSWEEIKLKTYDIPPLPPANNPRRQAFVTLCNDENYALQSLILLYRLRVLNTEKDLVIMTPPNILSKQTLKIAETIGVTVLPIAFPLPFTPNYLHANPTKPAKEISGRDDILWRKLWLWALEPLYSKIVLLDADIVVFDNIDEIFDEFSELAGSVMVETKEKIGFYDPSSLYTANNLDADLAFESLSGVNGFRGYGNSEGKLDDYKFWRTRLAKLPSPLPAKDWIGRYGLNSGVIVVEPCLETLMDMFRLLEFVIPQRPCCPTQEFLFRYFSRKRKFNILPEKYNVRRWSYLNEDKKRFMRGQMKMYHFVEREKPWMETGKKTGFRRIWWETLERLKGVATKRGLQLPNIQSVES